MAGGPSPDEYAFLPPPRAPRDEILNVTRFPPLPLTERFSVIDKYYLLIATTW